MAGCACCERVLSDTQSSPHVRRLPAKVASECSGENSRSLVAGVKRRQDLTVNEARPRVRLLAPGLARHGAEFRLQCSNYSFAPLVARGKTTAPFWWYQSTETTSRRPALTAGSSSASLRASSAVARRKIRMPR